MYSHWVDVDLQNSVHPLFCQEYQFAVVVSGLNVIKCILFIFRFEIAIFVLIFLNMVSMGIEHYDQSRAVTFVLEICNALFTTIFSLGENTYIQHNWSLVVIIDLVISEATVKMIGLRHHYFTAAWNLFDFVLVIASIVGILMEDLMTDFPVSPTLLRVVRVFRIGRILRLIKVRQTNCLTRAKIPPYLGLSYHISSSSKHQHS